MARKNPYDSSSESGDDETQTLCDGTDDENTAPTKFLSRTKISFIPSFGQASGQVKRSVIEVVVVKTFVKALENLIKQDPKPAEYANFLVDKRWRAAFTPRNEIRQAERNRDGNVFHHLATETTDWESTQISKVLKWLLSPEFPNPATRPSPEEGVKDKGLKIPRPPFHSLLEEMNDDTGKTPIFLALSKTSNPNFLNVLFSMTPRPENLGRVLCIPKKGESTNCIHAALQAVKDFPTFPNYTYQIIETIKGQCQEEELQKALIAQESSTGNNPLHLAMQVVTGSNLSRLWRYLQSEVLESLEAHEKESSEGDCHVSKLHPEEDQRASDMMRVVEWLVLQGRTALTKRNKNFRTPYQERISELYDHWENPKGHADFRKACVLKDPVASFVSYQCIRCLERKDAIASLYKTGQELAIDFNLEGFPHASITDAYLKRLETHLKFERTLKWVALPRLTFTKTIEHSRKPKGTSMRLGRDDMTYIFGWLFQRGVRKILKVTVVDNEFPAHRDGAIVECLMQFGVEIWDWKKLDLWSEVIHKSTPVVRQINLYSSGNQAVLKGWSAAGRFADRAVFPKLEELIVCLREGQEDKKTLTAYGQEFEKDLATDRTPQRKDLRRDESESKDSLSTELGEKDPESKELGSSESSNLAVRWYIDSAKRSLSSQIRSKSDLSQVNHSRVEHLKQCTKLLQSNKLFQGNKVKAVKIAIVDDGLDPSFDISDMEYTSIRTGCSFWPSNPEAGHSYFVPSGNHGTQVASLIYQICPYNELYIARVEDQERPNGRRVINVESAAQAIQWAADCKVDIICMSWTIETPGEEAPGPLKTAVEAAKKNGIVMFCSASDQGGSSSNQCWPGAFEDTCIRIGSCSSADTPSAWVQHELIDFLLPGENILVTDRDGTPQPQEGSSFATAVAAGLGGVLIFLYRLLRRTRPRQESDEFWDEKWDYTTMKRALQRTSAKVPPLSGHKLVKPEHYILDEYRKKLGSLLGPERAAAAFAPLDQQVLSEHSLEAFEFVMRKLLRGPKKEDAPYGS